MFSLRNLIFFIIVIICFGCAKNEFVKKANEANTQFTLVPKSISQIDFVNTVNQTNDFNCLNYTYALLGGGVAVGDINNDGLEDIYFISNQNSNKLYLNKGDFSFEDITESSNTSDSEGWSTGVSMIDINNDGWLDIYVCKSASIENPNLRENKLFINLRNGTFKEDAKSWGLNHNGFSIQSYFFDYDKDGDLDMYLVNHRIDFENTLRLEQNENQKFYPETSDHLFRNDGNYFTNVTLQAKLINKAWGLSASIGDFNNDGWPDIYVANDYIAPDYLYINNQNGTFSNQINTRLKHISFNSMGSDYADINNDFLPDLMVLEMSAEDHVRSKENMPSMNTEGFEKIVKADYHYPYMANVLQLNNGNGSFSDIGQLAGISKTDWSWAPLIADFDNDGYKDIFVSNGIERNFSNQDYASQLKKNIVEGIEMTKMEVIAMMPSDKLANYSYKNNGDLTFVNTSELWGFNKKLNSNGVAYADFDNDGDLDLVMNNMSDQATIYQNNATGNYLNIKLKGDVNNINGIGAKIKVFTENKKQYQEQYPTRGYLSSVSTVLNFGFADETLILKIEVVWDGGQVSVIENVQVNQTITVDIKDSEKIESSKNEVNRNLIPVIPKRLGIDFVHIENEFNDFSKQVLLPQKLSQQGPSVSVGDINNDGLDDFFIGGAKNQSAVIYIQNNNGTFNKTIQNALVKDAVFEDQKSLFFDADNDNDLDLYVTSGGYELSENSLLLQDRLYINDGTGVFIKSNALPKMVTNTKSVTSFDFDNDGYNDLVIGGHVIPGKYPLASRSYILKNEKGVFKDVTDEIAPGLKEMGIVNSMLFSDYDGDAYKDLIVVGEWMPITIFKNSNGHFQKVEIPEFKNTDGWYNTISAIDFDNDGDQDYFVGNLGYNNKFHPTKEKPLHIYGNNFDSNNTYDMVLSKDYKGNLVPVRGKECSTQQNAFIKDKIPTYKAFANSTLMDIYGVEPLKASYHKQVFEFGSMYLENKGNQSFIIHKLPNTAQMGPTMGFEFGDVNSDGFLDVIGVGNIYETEVETIRYDANEGYILLGNGKGELKPYKDINFYNGKNAKGIYKIIIANQIYYFVVNNNNTMSIFKLN
jgi:hypothetical protein